MLFPARLRFTIAAFATVVGISLVVGFGWSALKDVSREADLMESDLERLRTIEAVEEELHELGAGSDNAHVATLDKHVAELLAAPSPAGELHLLDQLQRRVALAKADSTPQRWSQAAEVISQISKASVAAAVKTLEATSKPARASARDILKLGATVAVVCGVLAALAFMRLRRERREAESQLRQRDRLAVLGTMAATVAHELNNPLATVSGCATAVRDRLRKRANGDPAGYADEVEYLDMVVDEARRCAGIVRSLRDLARDSPPAMAPSDLPTLVRDVVALVQMTQQGPRVAFEVAGEATLEIVCDPDKIKQLLLNLIVNARDACADGGRVRISVERDAEDGARLVVEDDGRGIAAKDLGRVFEPFHTDKTRGLGLGLFVCERVVSLHAGRIAAASDGPGRGARFTVSLPAHPPQRTQTAEASA